ncbi:MAG: hypothetical protein JWN34_1996 [Bryobacterales bacterium]|nr:hypothetical protein [Bryobacterales bacterium]
MTATLPATQALGVFPNMTRAEYDAIPALSNSGMKHLAISPLRYWFHCVNPDRPEEGEEETKAMRMGSAFHCAVLESAETFDSRYARALDPSDWPVCLETADDIKGWIREKGGTPKGTRKADWIEQAQLLMFQLGVEVPILELEKSRHFAKNADKQILRVDEWDRITGMTQALLKEPKLAEILSNGKPEVSIISKDPDTGVLLKCRQDWMAPRHTVDLKSFTQMRGKSIDKSIHDAIYYERYWVQGFLYDKIRRLETQERPGDVDTVYAFVESEQPHETRLKRLQPKLGSEVNLYWEAARQEVRSLTRLYVDCLDKYGLTTPWASPQEIESLTDEDVRQFSY